MTARRTRTAQRHRGCTDAERDAIVAERMMTACWVGAAVAVAMMLCHMAGVGL